MARTSAGVRCSVTIPPGSCGLAACEGRRHAVGARRPAWRAAVSRPLPECERRMNWPAECLAERCPDCRDTGGMERQQDYVLRSVEERGVRLIRLWFTDVLGQLKSFAITPGRAGERPRGGHDLRRLVHRRLQPGAGERRPGPARPQHLRAAALGRPRRRPRPGCSATSSTSTARPFEGDPRQVLRRNLDRARERGFTLLRRPRDGVLLLRAPATTAGPQPLDSGGYFDLTTADVAGDLRKRTHPHARGHGHPGRVLVPRGLRPASTRSTCATPTPSPWPTA